MYSKQTIDGKIVFEDKVIKSIVGISVTSCYGVVMMASVAHFRDMFFNATTKNYYEQGVTIHTTEEGIIDLEVHIVLGYSVPVRNTCMEIKKRIAFDLEQSLNIKVRNITIVVEAIDKVN